MESIEQQFQGTADFGTTTTVTIARTGDLINRIWLEITLPDLSAYTITSVGGGSVSNVAYVNDIGHVLLNTVTFQIGGQKIDRHYSEWYDIWHNLTESDEKRQGLNQMIGHYDNYNVQSPTTSSSLQQKYYIPLLFYFNREVSNSLPLVALQYHEIQLNITFRTWNECVKSYPGAILTMLDGNHNAPSFVKAQIYVDYVYLDTDERRRFAQTPHEYLVESIQWTGDQNVLASQSTVKIDLNFSQPVKELIWVYQSSQDYAIVSNSGNNIMSYSIPNANAALVSNDVFTSAQLFFNGHERFAARDGSYFRLVQPYQHHTRVPTKNIYVYSFALHPEEFQPSGSANYSRLDTSQLALTMNPLLAPTSSSSGYSGRIKIYAYSYNILRIASGMGSLSFAS